MRKAEPKKEVAKKTVDEPVEDDWLTAAEKLEDDGGEVSASGAAEPPSEATPPMRNRRQARPTRRDRADQKDRPARTIRKRTGLMDQKTRRNPA